MPPEAAQEEEPVAGVQDHVAEGFLVGG
uniref:Uncharacterized protein n=1 Tax=Arundo donax TaxID=35708 RepID=A0A0A9AGL5_ARUDO